MSVDTASFTDRFTEWTEIARGGEGRLHRVRDRWTGRLAALKVPATPAAQAAILDEYRLLSSLRHPCLIRSEDLVREAGYSAHLLEYVPAVAPEGIWEEGGESAVQAALVQALRALTYLHRRGFVHGDVAPGNILVWQEGARWRAKLADLGLALPAAEAARAGTRGTPGYWAPETARGEGSTPASDHYGLAATAYAWIEGRGPWDGASATEMVRALAAGPAVPRPRRRISPELELLLQQLGAADPARRNGWQWPDLRRHEAVWGVPTLVATVSGLEQGIEEWTSWLRGTAEGAVATLLLRGRIGSGRRTAGEAFARSLVADGWLALRQPPVGAGGGPDVDASRPEDPVLLAREMERLAQGRHVVLSWPSRSTEQQARVLRGFLAARDGATGGMRTLVIKPEGVDAPDADGAWLLEATRAREVRWDAPGEAALDSIRSDLFPPEEGLSGRSFRDESTPLSLVLRKQSILVGEAPARRTPGAEAIGDELAALWRRASHPARTTLTLLAWSDDGWSVGGLGTLLGWDPATCDEVMAELSRLHLTRRSHAEGVPIDRLTDEMTRDAILATSEDEPLAPVLPLLAEALERGGIHPGDLGLCRRLQSAGHALPEYFLGALERALGMGRFDDLLEIARNLESEGDAVRVYGREVWRRLLAAAQRAGKFEDEVRILRRLLAGKSSDPAIPERRALAQALANLGDWKAALAECDGLVRLAEAVPEDRVWAELQIAETLWQAGRFAEADRAYEAVEKNLGESMIEEWFRFAVGRARQHGQRGDMTGVKRYLHLAETKAGRARCEEDPLYLNTQAGLLIEENDLEGAEPVLHRSANLAAQRGNWSAFVMTSSRSGTLLYDQGRMLDAGRTGRGCLAVAEVLSSSRMLGFTNSFQGYAESHIGNVGSGWRRARRVLDLATSLSDGNLQLLGERLRLFIAAHMGWENELAESAGRARKIAEGVSERGSLAFISHYEGLYLFGKNGFAEAAALFRAASSQFASTGQRGSEAKSRLYLHTAAVMMEADQESEAGVSELLDDSFDSHAIANRPLRDLAHALSSSSFRRENPRVASSAIMSLWENGRLLEMMLWGEIALRVAEVEDRSAIKGKVLSAVQRIADSLEDAQLRRNFLGSAKARRLLSILQA